MASTKLFDSVRAASHFCVRTQVMATTYRELQVGFAEQLLEAGAVCPLGVEVFLHGGKALLQTLPLFH